MKKLDVMGVEYGDSPAWDWDAPCSCGNFEAWISVEEDGTFNDLSNHGATHIMCSFCGAIYVEISETLPDTGTWVKTLDEDARKVVFLAWHNSYLFN